MGQCFSSSTWSSKCKMQCKLCVGRIRLVRNKRQTAVKKLRREIADKLRTSRQESARIRVETLIRESLLLQALEVIELYLELLAVQAQLVEESRDIPPDMIEAVSSLVYSAQRLQDLPELFVIKDLLAAKYKRWNRDYIEEASSDLTCGRWRVNRNLIRCLSIEAPPPEEKLATLSDIAKEHDVEWDAAGAAPEIPPPAAPPGFGQGGFGQNGPLGQWGPRGGTNCGGVVLGLPVGVQAVPNRVSGCGAPKVFPNQQDAVETLPNRVQAKAKEEWADVMLAAMAAAEHAHRAYDPSDAAERYARRCKSFAGPSGEAGKLSCAPGPSTAPKDEVTELLSLPPKVPGGSAQGGSQRFVERSDSEIQRAYDAAVGPPGKKDEAPSAPPAEAWASLSRPASPSLLLAPPTGSDFNAGGAAA